MRALHRAYFARFQVESIFVPNDEMGLLYLSSSAVTEVTVRLTSVPLNAANELPITR